MNRRVEARQTDTLALNELAGRYRRDGFAFPYRVLPEDEATGMARDVEVLIESDSRALHHMRTNPHLVFPSVDRLTHDDRVLDAVERIIGPNLLLWNTSFFLKPPRSADFVSWHQDLTYWGLDGTDQVSAWVALSPITEANGCMRFVPGSHQRAIETHRDTFAGDNQLSRGQVLAVDFDESKAVPVTLAPGELSLHHGHLFHASGPNTTDAVAYRHHDDLPGAQHAPSGGEEGLCPSRPGRGCLRPFRAPAPAALRFRSGRYRGERDGRERDHGCAVPGRRPASRFGHVRARRLIPGAPSIRPQPRSGASALASFGMLAGLSPATLMRLSSTM